MLSKLRIFDLVLTIVPLLLVLIGIVMISSVTFPTVQFDLAKAQLIYAVVGIIVAAILTTTDYRNWQSLAYLFYIVGIVLLLAVLFLGSKQFGALRWLDFGPFQIQPSEIFKLVLIVGLARLLAAWSGGFTPVRLSIVLFLAALPIILVFKQPDLGTASVLVAITGGMLLFAKIPLRWWLVLMALALVLLPVGYSQLQPYQKSRIKTFLAPESDIVGLGYNVRQATIAIGSGGFLGQGLGRGTQSQLNFLPVAHTDFIFAGLAEAAGLIGATTLLLLYLALLARVIRVAELAKDQFGMFVALGVAVMLLFQIVVNIGMNLGLLPVTGIPLPLVSFGGTALIVDFICFGILQSIYIRHKKITF